MRSFYDSDGDGIGDLKGLILKLPYIQGLGAHCLWLMPVAESPSYHGYDVANYYRVNPEYGTNEDFKRLVAAAHRDGIRVLVDMVLNHVSREHPFFQEALRHPDSPYRSWFRWSSTDPHLQGPWGEVVWHRSPVRDEYYYGVFWEGMPDLNYETPAVREEAKHVARFWLKDLGVDGFRLDAVPYLVEEGDRLAGTPGTHAFLRDYAAYVHRIAPAAFTIGEVWDSTGALLPYYPDQLDAYFAFEVSNAILEAVRTGSAHKLLPPVLRLQRGLPADRWAPFLRNHDQTRTLTELGGDVARAKLAATRTVGCLHARREGRRRRGHLHRWRVQGQPRPGRLGRVAVERHAREGAVRRRGLDDQQPHGADRGDRGVELAEAHLQRDDPH